MARRRCSWAVVTALLVALASTLQHAQTAPLRLLLACSQASELMFRFTMQNVSAMPTAAVIGSILANDQTYISMLELTVRRAGIPDVTLTYVDPIAVGVDGRLDPWLIALPANASYSVTVPARNFRLPPNLTKELFVAPADLQLHLATREVGRANLDMQGISLIHVWVGTLASDWVRFPGDCHPDR
jgi:hypothetical protein